MTTRPRTFIRRSETISDTAAALFDLVKPRCHRTAARALFSWQIERSREPTEAFCVGGGAHLYRVLYPRTGHGCNGVPKSSQAVSGASSLGLQPRRQSWSYRHGCAVDALRRASRAAKSAKAGGSAATASPAQAEAAGVAFTSQSGPPQLADLKPSCAEYVSDADGITKASVAPKYECFAWRSFAHRRERNTRRVPLQRFAEALERRPGDIKVVIDSLQ